jgi:uncharacterized protein YdaU (DUF1376 family)
MSTPFMQLYIADYLGDTQHLTTEQHGAYLLLLMAMWRAGGRLPSDPKRLCRIAGVTPSRWAKMSADVMELFTAEDGTITQKRLLAEHQKAIHKSQLRKSIGRAGGLAKSLNNNERALAKASGLLKHSSEPEPEQEREENIIGDTAPTNIRLVATGGEPYALDTGTSVRLRQVDLDKWRKAFPHVAVEAELWGSLSWLTKQKNWFNAASGLLTKREREARERIAIATAEPVQPRKEKYSF